MSIRMFWAALLAFLLLGQIALADSLKLAVTTSFHNSGLSEVLLPEIKADLDLDIKLLVVGTGQALRLGKAGDVDAILVHSRAAEEAFLAGGFGTHRREIMFNDFVLIGPRNDPAGIAGAANAADALQRIAETQANFVSRGDDSGTHKKELSLWQGVEAVSRESWYRAAGASMGASLNTASGMNAYILADRASWLKFGNKGDLALLFSGDPVLFNQYAYLPINPDLHPYVKSDLALKLEAWLVGARAEKLISQFKVKGEVLFTFNATR